MGRCGVERREGLVGVVGDDGGDVEDSVGVGGGGNGNGRRGLAVEEDDLLIAVGFRPVLA